MHRVHRAVENVAPVVDADLNVELHRRFAGRLHQRLVERLPLVLPQCAAVVLDSERRPRPVACDLNVDRELLAARFDLQCHNASTCTTRYPASPANTSIASTSSTN